MSFEDLWHRRQSRRTALKMLGAAGGIGLGLRAGLFPSGQVYASAPANNPLQHLVIHCQENRSFDQYFGFYEHVGSFGFPSGYFQLSKNRKHVVPFHFTSFTDNDISHSWSAIHSEWDQGKMDAFVKTDGTETMGYYLRADLPYYYALADSFTLCGNYFCSVLGPTDPNRLYLWTATSGGTTNNNTGAAPIRGTLNWPTIADLMDQHGITWACYNLDNGTGTLGSQEDYNGLTYFQRYTNDSRCYQTEQNYYAALQGGTLPQVSFLISVENVDEHPPSSVRVGEQKSASLINALINSPYWTSSAFVLTYDEAGGFVDHVIPPQFDAYGAGVRVPTLIVSPWVKRGFVSGQLYEHSSIPKFIESTFNLPTLASINHQFDTQAPGTNNDAAGGNAFGPPAPPRDGLSQIGDFYECFDFTQDPNYHPSLPPAP